MRGAGIGLFGGRIRGGARSAGVRFCVRCIGCLVEGVVKVRRERTYARCLEDFAYAGKVVHAVVED